MVGGSLRVHTRLCKLQKGCTRLATISDKVYQLLAHGRWFSPGTPASSTTKSDRHDIAEILLKVALNMIFFLSGIHVFWSDQFSLLMYRCLLPSSGTVKMDSEENMENACYATK